MEGDGREVNGVIHGIECVEIRREREVIGKEGRLVSFPIGTGTPRVTGLPSHAARSTVRKALDGTRHETDRPCSRWGASSPPEGQGRSAVVIDRAGVGGGRVFEGWLFVSRAPGGCYSWGVWGQADVLEYLANNGRVGEECQHDHWGRAPGTGESVDIENTAK
jgi:hypothetical protein